MRPSARGSRSNSAALTSTSSAERPPTDAGTGEGSARTRLTSSSASGDIAGTADSTIRSVASSETRPAAAGPGGSVCRPSS